MPEPADRPPSLRDRIADALHCPTCGVEPGAHCLRARVDNRQPHMTRVQAADAVLPVVEAETARARASCCEDGERTYAEMERHLTQRAEEAERERDVALAAADPFKIDRVKSLTAAMTRLVTTERDAARKRAEEAEARNRQYDTAIAAERKGRLAAEAAVRRARELARNRIAVPADVLLDALTIEQPKENPDE